MPKDYQKDLKSSKRLKILAGESIRDIILVIILISLAAMICGGGDFEHFAQTREPWLRRQLKLPDGLPSDDTFRRVFTQIDPDRFCECFAGFVLGISGNLERQLIAIDGKTLRHSFENADPTNSWLGLKSIVCVEAHREEISTGSKSIQKRYYLTSCEPDAAKLQRLIRQHWSIENQCHWILDVTFDEDQCRIRKDHAAANLAMLRKMVLSLPTNDTTIKDSIRGKRYRAAPDENILEKILFPQDPK